MEGLTEVFSGFAVDDIGRAKHFYETVLGLDVSDARLGVEGADVPSGLQIHTESGARILIYPKSDHEPAGFTILNIRVVDIEAAVDDLTSRGVQFEQYESPRTDAKGIHQSQDVRPVAWFRDPAGNIISVLEA